MSNTQTIVSTLADILYSPIRINELETLMENAFRKVLNDLPKSDLQDETKPLRLKASAEFLGVAPTTLYSLVHQGKLKPFKPGGHLLFTRECLQAYLRGERPGSELKEDPSTYLTRNKKGGSK